MPSFVHVFGLFAQGITEEQKQQAQDFLAKNGWLIYAGAGLVALLVLLVLARKLLGGRRKEGLDPDRGLEENLAEYPPPGPPGSMRLTVAGQPARLRLVVAAPVGKQAVLTPE